MSLVAFFIGLYGYLFPGNINLMVMDLYRRGKYILLFWMLLLIVLIESLYCGGTLLFIEFLKDNKTTFSLFKLISFLLLILMGIWVLYDSNKSEEKFSKSTFTRGLISIIIHPQQIPFWMLIGLAINPIKDTTQFIPFVVFNALGTLTIMLAYMILGNRILDFFKLNLAQASRLLALLYIAIGTFSLLNFFN